MKQLAIKAAKGAFTAGGAAVAVSLSNGIPMTRHAWVMVGCAAGGAAFHGLWNIIEQSL
jgi:hypothetical protein